MPPCSQRLAAHIWVVLCQARRSRWCVHNALSFNAWILTDCLLQTCYAGGVGAYNAEIRGKLTGWQGFDTVKA